MDENKTLRRYAARVGYTDEEMAGSLLRGLYERK